MRERSLARAASVALALLVLAVAIFGPLFSREDSQERGSVASAQPEGRRAALVLLRELGFAAEAWRLQPGHLPSGPHLVWLARAPGALAGGEAPPREDLDPLDLARERGPGALRNYREFVEQGGTLLLPAGDAEREFLARELGIEAFGELERVSLPRAAGDVRLGGERLELPWGEHALDEAALTGAGFEPLLLGSEGELLALELPVGRGRVTVVAGDRFLDNAHLGEGDSAVLLVRLAERFAGEGGSRVLFDEGALGRIAGGSVVAMALAPRALPFTLHALVLLALLVWRSAWVREFPRDPEPLEQLSPLARAQSQAALLARGKKIGELASMLREGALERIALHLGAGPRERTSSAERAARLARLSAASGAPDSSTRTERWRDALVEREVASLAELAALDRDLRSLEAEAGGAERRPGLAARRIPLLEGR